ncbi:MAG: S8 family serine peptidase [Gemmatimonadaceae bacterium]
MPSFMAIARRRALRRALRPLAAACTVLAITACDRNTEPIAPHADRAAAVAAAPADAPFYYYDHQRVPLEVDPTRLVVETGLPTADAAREALAEVGVRVDSTRRMLQAPGHWVLHLPQATSRAAAAVARARLRHDARFTFASHAYRTVATRGQMLLVDRIIVKFKKGVSRAQVDSLSATMGTRVLRPPVPDSGYSVYYLGYPTDSAADPLRVVASLYEHPLVDFAEGDRLGDEEITAVPSDPYYGLQYYLKNTLTLNGVSADINVEPAWDLTLGSGAVKIIFIDTGVDSYHQEFSGTRPIAGFDAMWRQAQAAGLGEWAGGPYPFGSWDTHGTAVAGIAAGAHDGRGTAGVAPWVQIDAVRIFRNHEAALASDIGSGITWAYQRADVLNSSWSGTVASDYIKNAVNDALTKGRGGKGTIVVFAAGNDYATSLPWTATLPGVIAVAALTRTGARADYSNTGPGLTVSAFGGAATGGCSGADIATFDHTGAPGCNDGLGGANNYTSTFSGTSAATPQVSGVAALLLTREPGLTAAQVSTRIRDGADYWGDSNQFGAGKLNAYRTLVGRLTVWIGGESSPPSAGTYTYAAYASGGGGNYAYRWERSTDGGPFQDTGVTTRTISQYVPTRGSVLLRVTVTAGSDQAVATFNIAVVPPDPPCGGPVMC